MKAAGAWDIGPVINGKNYSEGMPDETTPILGLPLWYFRFPPKGGSVHYVTRAKRQAITAVRLRAEFRIEMTEGKFVSVDGGATPAVRLFIQRKGDDWSGTGQYATYRQWSRPLALSAGTHVLESILAKALWTNVEGKSRGLSAALADPMACGVTFGSLELSAGHGVYSTAEARFTMLRFLFL